VARGEHECVEEPLLDRRAPRGTVRRCDGRRERVHPGVDARIDDHPGPGRRRRRGAGAAPGGPPADGCVPRRRPRGSGHRRGTGEANAELHERGCAVLAKVADRARALGIEHASRVAVNGYEHAIRRLRGSLDARDDGGAPFKAHLANTAVHEVAPTPLQIAGRELRERVGDFAGVEREAEHCVLPYRHHRVGSRVAPPGAGSTSRFVDTQWRACPGSVPLRVTLASHSSAGARVLVRVGR